MSVQCQTVEVMVQPVTNSPICYRGTIITPVDVANGVYSYTLMGITYQTRDVYNGTQLVSPGLDQAKSSIDNFAGFGVIQNQC